MFKRVEHVVIAEALALADTDRFEAANCFFGGGTAIVLTHGEYRVSLDVDFLCADPDGYRELRSAAVERGVGAFFGDCVETIRPFRADQYGLRAVLALKGQSIKFEIVREARISLRGARHPLLGVPMLTLADQFAEKLLANADRGLDSAFSYRDAIDLGALLMSETTFPLAAIEKAEQAYGADIARKLSLVLGILAAPGRLDAAARSLRMAPEVAATALIALKQATFVAWPALRPPGV